jgi:hypothetical protein
MARPKLPEEKLHCIQTNVNFTEKQAKILKAVADYRDIPMQTLLREMVVSELDTWLVSMGDSLPANLHQ